jgi:hypothetical protein
MFVLRSTYQKQLDKNAELIEDRDSLRTKLVNALHAGDEHINRNAEFAIDFEQMNPFSIERNRGDENRPVTVFGYFNRDGTPAEWFLYCSLERHNRFVEEFHDYKAKQEGKRTKS